MSSTHLYSNSQPEKSSEKTISILVVDDDTTCLTIVAAVLRRMKYQVMTAKHPLDALCTLRIKGVSFDLAVIDVHMPDMDGFELQQQINKEFQLPVVLMSADDKDCVVFKGIQSGAAFFLMKPINPANVKDLWQYAKSWGQYLRSGQKLIDDKSFNDQRNNDFKRNSMENGDGESSNHRKGKIVWTKELHCLFLAAIKTLGPERAVPKNIVDMMNVQGLTREHVASHLQKYRIFLKRVSDANSKEQYKPGTIQSDYAYGNPGARMLNKLKNNKLWSLSHNIRQASTARNSSLPLGYGQSRLLNNPGFFGGLMTGTSSMRQYQHPAQAAGNNVMSSGNLSSYGTPTYGIGSLSSLSNVPTHTTKGTSGVFGPLQHNLSNFMTNNNYASYQIDCQAKNYSIGDQQQVNLTYAYMLNNSSMGLGKMYMNGTNLQPWTDKEKMVEDPSLGAPIGSNHVGSSLLMNGEPIGKQLGGEEANGSSSGSNNDVHVDDVLSWFPSPNQVNNGDISMSNNYISTASHPPSGDQYRDKDGDFLPSLLVHNREPNGEGDNYLI